MKAKEMILDFINLILIILLVAFCIIYFIAGDNFFVFSRFLQSMVPLAFFGIIFLVKIKIARTEIKERRRHDRIELTLYLNSTHKLVSDLIVFSAPILLGLVIYIARGFLDKIDAVLLMAVFLTMFFWQKYLFSKER